MDISDINPKKIKRIRAFIKRKTKALGDTPIIYVLLMGNLIKCKFFRKYSRESWQDDLLKKIIADSPYLAIYVVISQTGYRREFIAFKENLKFLLPSGKTCKDHFYITNP